jgi:hypothetical protein
LRLHGFGSGQVTRRAISSGNKKLTGDLLESSMPATPHTQAKKFHQETASKEIDHETFD